MVVATARSWRADMLAFIKKKQGNATAMVRAEWAEAIVVALVSGTNCRPAYEGGRGQVTRFSYGAGNGLIRKYLRGGIVRHFLKDSYFMQNRARHELRLNAELFQAGLPVPEPLGACWERHGLFFKGAIATREIEAVNLLDFVRCIEAARPKEAVEAVFRRCGRSIRRMHDMGVYHADLQVRNILVGPDEVYLIDFDKAKRFRRLLAFHRARNMMRLKRSFEKNHLSFSYFLSTCKGYGIDSFSDVGLRAMYFGSAPQESSSPSFDPEARLREKLDIAGPTKQSFRDNSVPKWKFGNEESQEFKVLRRSGHRGELHADLEFETILRALNEPGTVLKESKKSRTRRVGDWVVKEGAHNGVLGVLRHTFLRNRCRRGWRAALFLHEHGVNVPAPLAYVEKRRFGFITGNALISEFLEGFRNVEEHTKELARGASGEEAMHDFFAHLADALNQLEASGAYHPDLSGKNIFTKDRKGFCFIDLDAVVLNQPYDDAMRMKTHVQLYDSFCDFVDGGCLAVFLSKLVPAGHCLEDWMKAVQEGQRRRREEHEGKRTQRKKRT